MVVCVCVWVCVCVCAQEFFRNFALNHAVQAVPNSDGVKAEDGTVPEYM